MKRYGFLTVVVICALIVALPLSLKAQGMPRGAKALFDSGEGSAVRMSSGPARPAQSAVAEAPKQEKYVGISYKLALLKPNGDFTVVPKSHVFRTGDRVKMLVRSNRAGYLTILNVGPTGNTNVLFNEYVEGKSIYEIPRNTNFRFVGQPGSEKVLIMLSGSPNPFGTPTTTVASGPSTGTQGGALPPPPPPPPPQDSASLPPPPPPPSSGSTASLPPLPPPPSSASAGSLPPPPPMMLANSIEGAKDLVVEDTMKTKYAVISPKSGWKPAEKGTKDIVLESSGGENYGVVPVSAIEDGGILTLEVKLTHK